MRTALLFALLALSQAALAQKVYKCTGEDGKPVYSQMPCADDAEAVDTSRSLKTGTSPNLESLGQAARTGQIDMDASKCIRAASDSAWRGANARINALNQQIAGLERQASYANNNLAGATYESGIRQQIAALQTSIVQERTSASQIESAGIQACDQERQRRHQAEKDAKTN